MDVVSAAGSVGAVVRLLVQTITVTKQYVDGVKKSGTTVAMFLEELQILLTSLENLKHFLENEQHAKNFSQSSLLVSQMQTCEKNVSNMLKRLEGITESKFQKALWPFSEKEQRQSMQDVRAFSQWIQLSLSLDSSTLLTKTADEAVKIFSGQLESIRNINSISSRTLTIQAAIQAQERLLTDSRKDQDRQAFLSWLSDYDEHAKHLDVKAPRVDGTGDWLLESEEFVQWSSDSPVHSILWCHGDQGVGKSVLMSLVIDHLRKRPKVISRDEAVIYLYFEQQLQAQMSLPMMLGSLAKQLLAPCEDVPQELWSMYKTALKRSDKDLLSLQAILLNALSLYRRTYIVIDAVDEYNRSNVHAHTDLGKILSKLCSREDVQLLYSSRNYNIFPSISLSRDLKMAIMAHESDLRHYLCVKLDSNFVGELIDSELKSKIVNAIIGKAGGMFVMTQSSLSSLIRYRFLLAALQIQAVLDAPSIGEMEEACELLPSTLNAAFDATILQIKSLPNAKCQLAKKSLIWTSFLKNGCFLRIADLKEALAVRWDQTSTNSRLRPSTEMIVDCCRGLITVDQTRGHVRFSHLAIQEYLQNRKERLFPDAQELIFQTCTEYLRTSTALARSFQAEKDLQACVVGSPLLWYAASAFGYHANLCTTVDVTRPALQLWQELSKKNCILQVCQYLRGRKELYWTTEEAESHNLLHMGCMFGLQSLVRDILDKEDVEIDNITSLGTTALMIAASENHSTIVEWLLAKGADPKRSNWYGNALHCAAEAGQVEAIDKLIPHLGSDWSSFKNCHGLTPLQCAQAGGHSRAVQIMSLHMPKPLTFPDKAVKLHWYGMIKVRQHSPILIGLVEDNLELVKVLLAYGLDPDGRYILGIQPLLWACWYGKLDAVRLLLNAGARVDTVMNDQFDEFPIFQSDRKGTAHWCATAQNHHNVEQLLLQFGAGKCITPEPSEVARVTQYMEKVTEKYKVGESFTWYYQDDPLGSKTDLTPNDRL